MDEVMKQLNNPMVQGGLGALVLLIILLVVAKKLKSASVSKIERLVREGKYNDAAVIAERKGDFQTAQEYYLRAQRPSAAAHMAARQNKFQQAAQLYERAGNFQRAIHFFQKAGMTQEAQALRNEHLDPSGDRATPIKPRGVNIEDKSPEGRERKFREALANATSDVQKAKAQSLGKEAAKALMAAGDLKTAADVYRDAALYDEALHLYANVLGRPQDAAPIVEKMGNHERAAELYELAGHKARAAAALVSAAQKSKSPTDFIEKIARLSPEVAGEFTGTLIAGRPLTKESVDLYYQHGTLLEKSGDAAAAGQVYAQIEQSFGAYKDLKARMKAVAKAGGKRSRGGVAEPIEQPLSVVMPNRVTMPSGNSDLTREQIDYLAEQVAAAAARKLRSQPAVTNVTIGSIDPSLLAGKHVVGIEEQPVRVSLLFDGAVQAARLGPSVDSLLTYVGGQPCNLQNIEVYYRLGMSHLADGNWEDALRAFDMVEEASPGYRDAEARAEEIRGWQSAMGDKATRLRAADGGNSRYKLRGELGRGGMAVVYRGDDTVLGRQVALKFISENYVADDEVREMFEREARAVAQLNHPNIVTIHDFGRLEGRVFICMEFVGGRTVEELMVDEAGISIVESLRIMKQSLTGLAYAHENKIIHRDLKPANIMRTDAGLVKLMDFGLAKSIEGGSKASLVAGTPAYMPPEQLAGGNVDHRADIFAIGVTFYEMLSGCLPFEGMRRDMDVVAIDEHVPAVPPTLANAIMRAMHPDPDSRFNHVHELLAPIEDILHALDEREKGTQEMPKRAAMPAEAGESRAMRVSFSKRDNEPAVDAMAETMIGERQ